MEKRRKVTKNINMGLKKWVQDNWVDIANRKSDGSYPKCGRSGGEKRKIIQSVYLLQKLEQ
jgi:hypothetical protein